MAGCLSNRDFEWLVKTSFLFSVFMAYNDAQQNKVVAVTVMLYCTKDKCVL